MIEHGANGFLYLILYELEKALRGLLNDHELRRIMGDKGRVRVVVWYSVQVQAPRLAGFLHDIVNGAMY